MVQFIEPGSSNKVIQRPCRINRIKRIDRIPRFDQLTSIHSVLNLHPYILRQFPSIPIQVQTKIKTQSNIKPLLVFDIKDFIYTISKKIRPVLRPQIQPKYLDGNFRKRNYYVYVRPGAIKLLSYLVTEYKNVAIWTSMEERNAHPIIQHLLQIDDIESVFKFVWYRSECMADPNGDTYDILKPTSKINSNDSSVIIFTPSLKTVRLNNPNTFRIIPPFDASSADNDDEFLFKMTNNIADNLFDDF